MICLFQGDKSKWIKLRLKREKYFWKWKENIKFQLPSEIFIEKSQCAGKQTRTKSLHFLSAECLYALQSWKDAMQREWLFPSFHGWGKEQVWRGEGIAHISSKWQGGPPPALPESKGHVLNDHVTASPLRSSLSIYYLVLGGGVRKGNSQSNLGSLREVTWNSCYLCWDWIYAVIYDLNRKRGSLLRLKWWKNEFSLGCQATFLHIYSFCG